MISTHLVHTKNAGTYKHHLYGSPGFRILVLGYGDEYAWILNLDIALGLSKEITQTNKDV